MTIRQAIVLAGGQATRLRPYTDDRPKAMVDVAGKPIIVHQLEWLARDGVEDVVVSCGYLADVIRDHLGYEYRGVRLAYAYEDEPLGRGGGLKLAARSLAYQDERWLALNCDVITSFAIADLIETHARANALATMALAQYRTSWGIAQLEGDLVRGFVQSPRLPYWINAGVYVFEPELAALLPDRGDHEDTTFPSLAKDGRLAGYRIQGYWRGIDTVKDVLEGTRELEWS